MRGRSQVLRNTGLFEGIEDGEMETMLKCMGAFTRRYAKDEFLFRRGDRTECLGVVLDGNVRIIREDWWGNRTSLGDVGVGMPLCTEYACTSDPLDVSSVWLGGGFLNLRLIVKTRLEGAQYFGFIDRGLVSWPDGRTTASVQLYHDQSGDPVSFSRTAYLSMPLSAFDGVLTSGDTIRLRVNTFGEGEKTWTLVR